MTEPYYAEPGVSLWLGDCRDVMAAMPTASVDSICTDPPYELGFMGRAWDASGIAYNPATWREALRVLRPGGHLAAFGGTRTYHRMAVAIEDAGFEIRDSLHWIYGSGFPKSLDVGKVIDAAAGAEREVVGVRTRPDGGQRDRAHGGASGGTLAGSVTGTLNTNGAMAPITAPATADAARWDGWGTALKPAHEPIILARKPLDGTVAANVLAHGTGALNIDATRVDGPKRSPGYAEGSVGTVHASSSLENPLRYQNKDTTVGRWPANLVLTHSASCVDGGACTSGCPVAELDQQSGNRPGFTSQRDLGAYIDRNQIYGRGVGNTLVGERRGYNDHGGSSRFFPVFRYEPKAPAAERPRLADGTAWPTVKPVALMRWLVRLVTPPGGTVLDPFCGTGATAEAARAEGVRCVLIEQDETAAQLAVRRLTTPKGQRNKPAPAVSAEPTAASDVQLDLFGGAA